MLTHYQSGPLEKILGKFEYIWTLIHFIEIKYTWKYRLYNIDQVVQALMC